jgi:hypothetical protein
MIDSILRPIASQLVNVSATTAQSAADFSEMTVAIELYATQAMFVRFSSPTGTDTAAVGTDMYIELGGKRTYRIGSKRRLSALRSTADGILYITELTDPTQRRTPQ